MDVVAQHFHSTLKTDLLRLVYTYFHRWFTSMSEQFSFKKCLFSLNISAIWNSFKGCLWIVMKTHASASGVSSLPTR